MTAKTCSLLALARPTLMKGSPFAVDDRWVMVGGGCGSGWGQGGDYFGGGGAHPLLVIMCSL